MICEKCAADDPTTDDRRACSIAHCDTCVTDCQPCCQDMKEEDIW